MERRHPIQIGELIRQAIEESGSSLTYKAQRACFLWPEVVGKTINRYTTARWIQDRELHVRIASAAVKNELMFMTDRLLAHLNELVGTGDGPAIEKIVIH